MMTKRPWLLVGDNPFHGISHLSQERARTRSEDLSDPGRAARILEESVASGADGFMFSVSETTLSILKALRLKKEEVDKPFLLYPIVPYAYDYVRSAARAGGLVGLAGSLSREILSSRNTTTAIYGMSGLARRDATSLVKSLVAREVSRVRSSAGEEGPCWIDSVLLHEIVTDMALALNLRSIFSSYMSAVTCLGFTPGIETRNFAFLLERFGEWDLDLQGITIAAPFNAAGFQMPPTREDCERALGSLKGADVIAMSVMAAGYLRPGRAFGYVASLPNLAGIAVGVSSHSQVRESFALLRSALEGRMTEDGQPHASTPQTDAAP